MARSIASNLSWPLSSTLLVAALAACGDLPAEPSSSAASQAATAPQVVSLSSYPGAVCANGKPATYYVERTTGSDDWLVFLEGGITCSAGWMPNSAPLVEQSERCAIRYALEKPKMKPAHNASSYATLPQYQAPGGLFDTDPTDGEASPFEGYNRVFVHSCSADAWLGEESGWWNTGAGRDPDQWWNLNKWNNLWRWHFQGKTIVDAVISDLEAELDVADDVVVAGFSTGGVGLVAHLDDIADRLSAASVRGLFDSSWIERGAWDSDLAVTTAWVEGQMLQQETAWNSASVGDDDCLANHVGTDALKCREMGFVMAEQGDDPPYLQTPSLVMNSMADKATLAFTYSAEVSHTCSIPELECLPLTYDGGLDAIDDGVDRLLYPVLDVVDEGYFGPKIGAMYATFPQPTSTQTPRHDFFVPLFMGDTLPLAYHGVLNTPLYEVAVPVADCIALDDVLTTVSPRDALTAWVDPSQSLSDVGLGEEGVIAECKVRVGAKVLPPSCDVLPVYAPATTPVCDTAAFPAGIATAITNKLAEYPDIPGAVVAFHHPSTGSVVASFGVANTTTQQPMPINAVFDGGSVHKLFKWVALERMYDDGLFDYDDPIVNWTSFTPPVAGTTVRQLTNHSTGMVDIDSHFYADIFGRYFTGGLPHTYSYADMMGFLASDPNPNATNGIYLDDPLAYPAFSQPFVQGVSASYSSYGPTIAEFIIQDETGTAPYAYVTSEILGELNLGDTSIAGEGPVPDCLVQGYGMEGGSASDTGRVLSPNMFEALSSGVGGLMFMSGCDSLQFARAISDPSLGFLSAATIESRTDPAEVLDWYVDMGRGVFNYTGNFWGHGGNGTASHANMVGYDLGNTFDPTLTELPLAISVHVNLAPEFIQDDYGFHGEVVQIIRAALP